MDNNMTKETKVQAIIDKIRRYGLTEVILDGSDEGALEDWKIYDEDYNYDSYNYSGRKLYVHRIGIVDGELGMLGMWVTFGYGPDFFPLVYEEKEDWESIPDNMLDCLYDTLVADDADYEFEYTVKVSMDGITYEDNIVTWIDEGKEGKIVLPHGVKAIGHAFAYREEITEVELPTTLNYIYASAFNNCSSLEAINLPKSLKHLYDSCFQAWYYPSFHSGPLAVVVEKANGERYQVVRDIPREIELFKIFSKYICDLSGSDCGTLNRKQMLELMNFVKDKPEFSIKWEDGQEPPQ